MELIQGKTFRNEKIDLSLNDYTGCTFIDCELFAARNFYLEGAVIDTTWSRSELPEGYKRILID